MFRDLKEYQELQKLYEEKVSKTEDIQEFKSKFSKPAPPVKSPMEAGMGPGAARARAMAKARIAAKNVENKKVDTLANKVDSKPPKPAGADIDTSSEIESSSAEFKANEGDKFNKNFNKQNAKPTFQKNRDKLNQSRQNQNKDRLKDQLGGVKKTVGKVGGAIKSFADRFKAKPIERKEGQTSVRQRSNVKTKSNTQNNKETTKIIPKPNTGTDTEKKTNKIIPKPNTGTDTETKTNTQIKKMPGSGKEINPKAKVTQTTSTNDKGQKVTTTTAKTSLQGSEATDAIKKAKERRAQLRANSMKEAYASMYNQPVEPENIDETKIDEGATAALGVGAKTLPKIPGALKAIGAGAATGAGALKLKNVFKSTRVKGSAIPEPDDDFIRSSEAEKHPDDVEPSKATKGASKADSDQGKPKIGKVTTYKQNKKTGKFTKSKPKRDKKAEMFGQGFDPYGYGSMYDHHEYEPYDVVLEYLLSTEQAATIEEANYIMTEMDAKTIQDIVSQQLNEQN